MPVSTLARSLAVVVLLGLPLGACVSGPANPSAARAAELANTVSRANACRAGTPRASTLEQFLASERRRGASPEQVASALSTYVTVSEGAMVNQSVAPQACDGQERAALRAAMLRIRAGAFETR